jgi:hypothetical protein
MYNFELKSKVINKIYELNEEILDLENEGQRILDSRKAQREIIEIVQGGKLSGAEYGGPEFIALLERAKLAGVVDHLERLQRTVKMDLVHLPKRYVATSAELICPAGFSRDDRVFVQNKVMINFDSLADIKRIPASDVELRVFDLEEVQ